MKAFEDVAPFAGAWIEIENRTGRGTAGAGVAPFAGAWIEMLMCSIDEITSLKSLPSRERGLKFKYSICVFESVRVAPFAGAWIEIRFLLLVTLLQ